MTKKSDAMELPTGKETKKSIKAANKYLKGAGREPEGYKKFWKKRRKK